MTNDKFAKMKRKFSMDTPSLAGNKCGPHENEKALLRDRGEHSLEVSTLVQELAWKVAHRDDVLTNSYHCSKLPPLLNGEYDAILPGERSMYFFWLCILSLALWFSHFCTSYTCGTFAVRRSDQWLCNFYRLPQKVRWDKRPGRKE